MARFWWGCQGDKKNIHWMNWDSLCMPKNRGGLSFRSSEEFNRAMLAKQGWRLLKDDQSLVAQVLKSKYFNNCSFLEARLGKKSSFVWRSIIWCHDLLKRDIIWRIENGKKVIIYEELDFQTFYFSGLRTHQKGLVRNLWWLTF